MAVAFAVLGKTDEGIMKEKKKIHLSGIGGTAMASLAGLLQLEGHTSPARTTRSIRR